MLGDISYRTLHYYETKLGINIARDGAGNRIYSDQDIVLFDKIIGLKKKGMSLDGIKALFIENGLIEPEADTHLVVVDEKTLELKDFLISEIRAVVASQMREELIETNSLVNQLLQENHALREQINDLKSQNEDHFSKIDQRITQWREEHYQAPQDKKPWFKKMLGK